MRCYISITILLLICNTFALEWEREAVEWGITLGTGAGAYALSRSGPFFEEPLFGGETDKPLVDETVPSKWLYSVSALSAAGILAIPAPNDDIQTRYLYAKGMVQTLAINSFLTTLGKDFVGRYRPNADARAAAGYDEKDLRDSFPSGHASTSFAVASYLTLYLWEATGEGADSENIAKGLFTAILAGTAGWVGYTRINDNAHRFDEVLAGAALGTAVGAGTFYYQHAQAEKEAPSGKVSVSPIGITLTWRF